MGISLVRSRSVGVHPVYLGKVRCFRISKKERETMKTMRKESTARSRKSRKASWVTVEGFMIDNMSVYGIGVSEIAS